MSDERKDAPASETVFGAPDQESMIAKIDTVSDDDLSSTFFENSIQDVEDAAVRMFDVGVRTLTDDNAPLAAFATAPAPAPMGQPVAPGADGRFDSPAVRRAFILGGPRALAD